MRSAFTVANVSSRALRALNYSPEVDAFRSKAKVRRSRRLGDLVADNSLSYGGRVDAMDCDSSYGVEFLSQSDMFSAEPHGRMVRRDLLPNDGRRIRKWQVLIAGAGTLGEAELYGRSVLADARLEGRYACGDALALTFREPNSSFSLFTYGFLSTKTGIRCLRSTSYGTKILRFRPDLLADLPVPCGSDTAIDRVATCMRTAVENRELYAEEMKRARQIIENVPGYSEALSMCAVRVARVLVWHEELTTLGAWNYASTGGALRFLRQRWKQRLRDLIEPGGLFNGVRFVRIPCEVPFGIDLLSQRDVFLIRGISKRIKHPGLDDKMLFVPGHAILLGSHGQLTEGSLFGRAESAASCGVRSAITQDILRIIPLREYSEILLAFLSTSLGSALLRSTAVGTSVPTMHLELLNQLPIPELSGPLSTAVKRHVSAAIASRVRSNSAEAEGVRIVEEEILPEWLS